MKVDSNMTDDTSRIGSLAAAEAPSRAPRAGATASYGSGDTVKVSRAASDLAQAAQAAHAAPEAHAAARAARVQQLQQVAKSGDLAVDIHALAQKILSDEQGLQ